MRKVAIGLGILLALGVLRFVLEDGQAAAVKPTTEAATPVETPGDVAALAGKTRAQLQSVFPGTDDIVSGWGGWKTVRLDFTDEGRRLVAITFTPMAPIAEADATALLRDRFGLALPQAAYHATPLANGWKDLSGPVRTVNLFKAESGNRISDIAVFFR